MTTGRVLIDSSDNQYSRYERDAINAECTRALWRFETRVVYRKSFRRALVVRSSQRHWPDQRNIMTMIISVYRRYDNTQSILFEATTSWTATWTFYAFFFFGGGAARGFFGSSAPPESSGLATRLCVQSPPPPYIFPCLWLSVLVRFPQNVSTREILLIDLQNNFNHSISEPNILVL